MTLNIDKINLAITTKPHSLVGNLNEKKDSKVIKEIIHKEIKDREENGGNERINYHKATKEPI